MKALLDVNVLIALAVEAQAVFVTLDNRINYRTVKTAKPNDLFTFVQSA